MDSEQLHVYINIYVWIMVKFIKQNVRETSRYRQHWAQDTEGRQTSKKHNKEN
jgi:hypothetical protein